MSKEVFVEFDGDEPIKIIDYDKVDDKSVLCTLYTHDENVHMLRVGTNNYHTARFAGKLIGDLGFRIPHPEFYPDEYSKFEKDWAEFTKHAKDHRKIMEHQDRQALLLQELIDHLLDSTIDLEEWSILLDGNIEDLRKLGVYK